MGATVVAAFAATLSVVMASPAGGGVQTNQYNFTTEPSRNGPGARQGRGPCSVPNMTTGPNGDIYFGVGGRSYSVRMTAATSPEGAGAGNFSSFRPPVSPFPNNPDQREPHAHDQAFGANGNLFVANPHVRPGPTGIASTITELTPNLQFVRRYDIPNQPETGNQTFTGGITRGPDNRVYFVSSEFTGDEEISAITPGPNTSAAAVQTYRITPEDTPGLALHGAIVSSAGHIWFAATQTQFFPGSATPQNTNQGTIGRLNVATGQVDTFDTHVGYRPANSTGPGMAVGPGGIWYTETEVIPNPRFGQPGQARFINGSNGRIALLNPNTGAGPHYTVAGSDPRGLTIGGDGAIWFVSAANPQGARGFIGRLDPNTGRVNEFPLAPGALAGQDIATGRLGDVYYSVRPAGSTDTCSIVRVAVVCGGRLATMVGTSGSDNLQGTPGDDVIDGLGGNDNIQSRGGQDVVCGGGGNDFVDTGGGADVVYGEDGNDHLVTAGGRDVAFGGAGYDRIQGGDGLDVIFGERGTDVLYGEDGNDQVFGGPDSDALFGGMGNDNLFGEAGSDWLDGEADTDRCDGGPDSDAGAQNCEVVVNVP